MEGDKIVSCHAHLSTGRQAIMSPPRFENDFLPWDHLYSNPRQQNGDCHMTVFGGLQTNKNKKPLFPATGMV